MSTQGFFPIGLCLVWLKCVATVCGLFEAANHSKNFEILSKWKALAVSVT